LYTCVQKSEIISDILNTMSRIRFIGALVVSVALIGGALWFRFVRIAPYSAQVVSVSELEQLLSEDAFLKDLYSATTTPRAISTTTLSQTDLIGREMLTDYLSLKSKGEVTPDNLVSLADKYAEGIMNLDIKTRKASLNQIIVLPDSEANLATYGNTMTNIRSKYKALVAAQYTGSGIADINSATFSTFMGATAKLYQASANELLLVRVPVSLAGNHLELVNNYLENAEVMKLISNTSKNPTQAYAALNVYTQNTEKESKLLLKIQTTLMASGIMFNTNI